MQSRRRNKSRRGFSLIEIVVAIAIIAMISGGIVVAVMAHKRHADITLTTTNAETILGGVKAWQLEHDSGSCPTVPMLISDGEIARGKSTKADAWGQPWLIKCEENDVTVSSRGPDKLPGTEDDIQVPSS